MDSKHVIFFMYVLIYIVVILELLFGDSKSGFFFFFHLYIACLRGHRSVRRGEII